MFRIQKVISAKGLVTIPEVFRKKWNIKKGDNVVVWIGKDFLILAYEDHISEIQGSELELVNALVKGRSLIDNVILLWGHLSEEQKQVVMGYLNLEKAKNV